MKAKCQRIVTVILVAAMALGLMACGGNTTNNTSTTNTISSSTENPEDVLVMGTTSLGTEMFAMDTGTPVMNNLVMQTLTRCHYADEYEKGNETYGAQPNLAESLEPSEDYLTWTIHLRQGVQWQNGYGEFTAADVDFTWNELMNPDNNAGISYYFAACDPDNGFIDSWKIIDDYTIEVHLAQAEALFPYDLADVGFIVYCKNYIEEVGMEAAELAPIGTGPWCYNKEESVSGDVMVFDRNDDYWGTVSDFRQIRFKLAADSNSALMMLQNGQIDMFQADMNMVQEAIDLGYQTMEIKDVYNLSLVFGGQQLAEQETFDPTCPWADHTDEADDSEWNVNAKKIREALCLAIDKDAILENIVNGYGTRSYLRDFTTNMVQTNSTWELIDYDPERAKELLAEAGYTDGFDKPITFYVPNVASYGVDTTKIANACCDYLEAIGLEVDRVVEDPTSIGTTFTQQHENAWAMTIDWAQWVPDPLWAWAWSGRHDAFEYKTFWSPEKDEYIDMIKNTVDDDERYALEMELGNYLYDSYTECAICSTSVIYVHNETVSDWTPISSYEMTYNWQMNLEAIQKAE